MAKKQKPQVVQKGAIGQRFEANLVNPDTGEPANVSAATDRDIFFLKPDGTVVPNTAEWTTVPNGGAGDGSDGKLDYTTSGANELDQIGHWEWQARVNDELVGALDNRGEVRSFEVKKNIE